ncbi:MAG: ABC transporter ATP-binding protein [Phycisphaerae bacterium]|nr:ABC transporter ATP-binding protein [Phycisphaerae bacterium]
MIEIKSLRKVFGSGPAAITAVDGVSFSVRPGEVLGFLGPNGAGKSTTMKMVTGFLAPTSGTAVVCGHDILGDALAAKRCIGYLPEGAPAYADMTPEGFLGFIADARGLRGEERRSKIGGAVDRLELGDVMRQPIETLSKGFKRRVGLAQAILHDPAVLVMDEPTDGLDPNQKQQVRSLIRAMARPAQSPPKAIVLSTHILEEVDAVCTRAIIIARGRIVSDGTPEEFHARSRRHNAVVLRVRAEGVDVKGELSRLPGVAAVEAIGGERGKPGGFMLVPRDGKPIFHEVARHCQARSWEVDELRSELGRLDEVFRELTRAGGVS